MHFRAVMLIIGSARAPGYVRTSQPTTMVTFHTKGSVASGSTIGKDKHDNNKRGS